MTDLYHRVDGYTTNGFFLIKSELENSYMRRQETSSLRPDIKGLLNRSLNTELVELALTAEVKEISSNYIARVLARGEDKVLISKRFLHYFGNLKGVTFWQKAGEKYSPHTEAVVIKRDGEFIGLIMPIRVG